MKYAVLVVVTLVLVFSAVSLQAQVNDTYIITAAANASGANGTRWATDFHLFNPQSYPLKVRLDYLPTGGSQGYEIKFTVQPNQTAFADDVLRQLFDVSGTGSLLVATFQEDNPTVPNNITARSFLVTTKTFNNASSGTFGQGIAGTWIGLQNFNTDGISSVASGVSNSSGNSSGFRTNIGAVNLGRFTATLYVSVYDDLGHTVQSQIPFVLPPQGHFQDRLPVAVDHGSVEFFVSDPNNDAVVFPYVSIIDNRSGDPVYVNPVLLASPGALFKKLTTEPGRRLDTNIAHSISERMSFLGEARVESNGKITMNDR